MLIHLERHEENYTSYFYKKKKTRTTQLLTESGTTEEFKIRKQLNFLIS